MCVCVRPRARASAYVCVSAYSWILNRLRVRVCVFVYVLLSAVGLRTGSVRHESCKIYRTGLVLAARLNTAKLSSQGFITDRQEV